MCHDDLFINLLRIIPPLAYLAGKSLYHSYNLVTTTVTEREDHCHSFVVACQLNHALQCAPNAGGQTASVADREESDAVAHHFRLFGSKIMFQKPHQRMDLVLRSEPVLGGEGVQ